MSLLDLLTLEHTHVCPSCNNDYSCTCPACCDGSSHFHKECPKCAANGWRSPTCLGFKFVRWHASG